MSKDMPRQRLGALITNKLSAKMYNKKLYKVIKPKLDSLKEFHFEQRPLVLMDTNKGCYFMYLFICKK